MNSNSYFSHDGNARNDSKIVRLRMKHGAAGYGVYFMILERLREESEYMSVKDYNMIAFDLRVDASLVKSVVEDFGLFAFTEDGECFYSESFNRRMEVKDEVSRRRSEVGKKGGAPKGNRNATKNDVDAEKQAKGCFETSNRLNENNQKQAKGCFETSNRLNENNQKQAKGCFETSNRLNENNQKQAKGCFETSNKSKVKESKENNKETHKDTQTRTCAQEESLAADDDSGREVYSEERRDYFVERTAGFFNEMVAQFHSSIKPIRKLTDERKEKIAALCRRYSGREIGVGVCNAMKSDYLNGRTKRRRQPADFDWIFDEQNFIRILEGNC